MLPVRKMKKSLVQSKRINSSRRMTSLVHGLLRIIRRRYFPRKIALCKSLTQVRDRRLGFKKLNKSKNSSNLDILIPSKFDGFVVSSFWMEVMKVPIKSVNTDLKALFWKKFFIRTTYFAFLRLYTFKVLEILTQSHF